MRYVAGALAFLLLAGWAFAQTTEGLITGTVVDQATRSRLHGAKVEFDQIATNTRGTSVSSPDGNYYLPMLPPGLYHIRVSLNGYQPREAYGISVAVAGYVRLDFELRPLHDVWERGRYGTSVFRDNTILPFYGPDVDPSYIGTFEPERGVAGQLEPSISNVIDPRAIDTLPLAGRDVYSALVLQPGVAVDSATNRSLGLSANGQRPASSNFLLDGVEMNNSLLNGPALQVAPEMVQEYRVSTNNFSAEYGRTSGYIANAVTRSAAPVWHGIGYGDWNNSVLNANTFQNNANGIRRNTAHQIESGFSAGGAIPHTRLLSWTAFDYFGSRSFSNPALYILPTQALAASLAPGSRAAQLLHQYPPVQWASFIYNTQQIGPVYLTAPITLRRVTGLERVDYAFTERQRLTARFAADSLDRPDFNWSPYSQAPLKNGSAGTALRLTSMWSPNLTTEIRAGFHHDTQHWNFALANLPQMLSAGADLPGYCCAVNNATQEGYYESSGTMDFAINLLLAKGPHVLTAGAGLLNVRDASGFPLPPLDSFSFDDFSSFAADQPYQFSAVLSRTAWKQGVQTLPNSARLYRYYQPYLFAQEDWRVSPRLTLNAGIRFDRFGAPVNIGSVDDVLVLPGAGATLDQQIASATIATHTGSLYPAQPDDVSVRIGFSLLLPKSHEAVLRGGYGTFYDRPQDNFWQTASVNDFESVTYYQAPCPIARFYSGGNYSSIPAGCMPVAGSFNLFDMTLFQNGLRAPRVQSLFFSLQQPVSRNLFVELNGAGSRGRNLFTTDIVNRFNREVSFQPPANGLPNIDYRTNQGFSDYAALSATLRYRSGPATVSIAYAWSHSIDNQSDPLRGEYFDLGFSNQTDRTNRYYLGSFSVPGDTRSDRGNSDFDQRQNFVGWTSFLIPHGNTKAFNALLRNWTVASVFSVRSGLPYSVYAGETNCSFICNTRANLLNPMQAYLNSAAAGGIQLLNSGAFGWPSNNQQGNTGRNEFTGPGFATADLSLSRSFPIRQFGEQARLILRTDWFNLLNHANLQNPEAYLGPFAGFISPQFGISLYGNTSQNRGYPVLTPLLPDARQIHVLLRFEF